MGPLCRKLVTQKNRTWNLDGIYSEMRFIYFFDVCNMFSSLLSFLIFELHVAFCVKGPLFMYCHALYKVQVATLLILAFCLSSIFPFLFAFSFLSVFPFFLQVFKERGVTFNFYF